MSEDPVEQGGRAMQQAFMQSMQTAAMVAGLFGRRAGEARSQTEFLQRMRVGENKEARSAFEHALRVQQKLVTNPLEVTLAQAKINEVEQRIKGHKEERRATTKKIKRADKDFDRREEADKLALKHKKELHELEKEYKNLQIQIRRRAAGLTDTLTDHGGKQGAAATSAAAHAAAQASAGLSDENAEAAQAFEQRFTEDTGADPEDFLDATVVPDSQVPVEDVIDAEIVEDFDGAEAGQGSAAPRVFIADVNGLADALTVLNYFDHAFPGTASDAVSPGAEGIGFEAAVADAGPLHAGTSADPDPGPGLEFGFDPPLALPAAPSPEVGP
ncbi:hypothetical protein ACFYO1_02875 [Nocardia sp. NPDC006044]|uniref:hypothetical protein n=1 Tax=Nocardia sp. NPDC006044 TaxID=3364306 RepID=UPI003677AB5C